MNKVHHLTEDRHLPHGGNYIEVSKSFLNIEKKKYNPESVLVIGNIYKRAL